MNGVYTMEAANLFCGKDNNATTASNHLTLQEMQLPSLEEQYTDHRPGGAPIGVEIDTVIDKLQSTFKLIGWTPQVMTLIGSWQANDNYFTAYGLIRDRMTGNAIQSIARMKGRLGRVAPDNYRRGDVMGHAYSIRAITHYELIVGGDQIFYWDFYTNQRLIGGIDQNAALNNLLNTGAQGTGGVPLTPTSFNTIG